MPIEALTAPRLADRTESRLSVMRFLNEVADDYPDAVSLASGRPADSFFDPAAWPRAIAHFQQHLASTMSGNPIAAGRRLAQYGRTNGLINELVAEQLRLDERLHCDPARVVITAGCQEAISLCVQTLCTEPGDVIVARNPTYIGITGVADLLGIEIVPLDAHLDGDAAAALRSTVTRLRAQGKRPRALYLIPQFDNPTGTVMPRAEREAILSLCRAQEIVVLEDNAYGMFRFDGEAEPPLAAIDDEGVVVYLGTYSKTICPAVRIGCVVVPPTLFGDRTASEDLLDAFTERKSFASLNTSQLNQAVVGGLLLEHNGTLQQFVEGPRRYYQNNRDVVLGRLHTAFAGLESLVTWNRPNGGFFLSLALPFVFGQAETLRCAADYGVVVMPMSFFALDDSQQQRVRIAFSGCTPRELETAIDAFAQYVRDRLSGI